MSWQWWYSHSDFKGPAGHDTDRGDYLSLGRVEEDGEQESRTPQLTRAARTQRVLQGDRKRGHFQVEMRAA